VVACRGGGSDHRSLADLDSQYSVVSEEDRAALLRDALLEDGSLAAGGMSGSDGELTARPSEFVRSRVRPVWVVLPLIPPIAVAPVPVLAAAWALRELAVPESCASQVLLP
jgi:hypothetical protein